MGRTRWEQRKARIPWRVVTKGSHCLPSLEARNHTKALPWSGKEHQLGIRDSASALCSLPGRLPQLCRKLRWRAGSKAPAALILCASVAPSPAGPGARQEPTWFSVAGWHSSSRTPNALGAAFLFFLMMLMPQGVLEVETLSSGVGGGRESKGELGAQGGAATTLGHKRWYITFTH